MPLLDLLLFDFDTQDLMKKRGLLLLYSYDTSHTQVAWRSIQSPDTRLTFRPVSGGDPNLLQFPRLGWDRHHLRSRHASRKHETWHAVAWVLTTICVFLSGEGSGEKGNRRLSRLMLRELASDLSSFD